MPSSSDTKRAFVALAATTALQVYASLAATAPSVLAPEIAQAFAIAPKWIGVFVGLIYAGAMVASLACGGFIERFGPIRVSQIGVMLCALGTLTIAVAPHSAVALLIVAALTIGIGYGPITPASSHLLIRTAPPSKLALTFSIKQTGVPAGAALAGAALPALALLVGWRVSLAVAAVIGIIVVSAAQPARPALDADRGGRTLSPASVMAPLRIVWRSRTLVELALVSFVYAGTQVCLTSFLVVYLTESLGWSLVGAGFALASATLGGVVGRVVWGMIADRFLRPRSVLGIIGLLAALCGAILSVALPSWPTIALIVLAACFGATAIGWNGVQLSEVARHAPPGAAGAVTGASAFVTFSGVVAGPPIFALLAASTDGYRAGFAVSGALSGVSGFLLLLASRGHRGGGGV